MDVTVKHGTTNINEHVIAYVREHNICSGIGTLELTLSLSYTNSINPHDTFSIYENGDFKVKYYVSDVSKNAPEGTIRLQCQDKSKYLVDYFISEQYTIDYPSYTKYWIGLFFDQAGIDYEFTTDDPGQLLSNYTVLGLQPAYDQIMMLCQLSGWYFYFDGNGTAIIGSLTTDVSSAGSVNKFDILDIKKTTDDKMLRNRAVVWGGYDPLRHENSYATITTHTPYNYDDRDIRTMVVSNNNIPNLASAYDIANVLIKEFAKPTIVKEITIWGARNYILGEFLRVSSNIWSGRGLITTFSVSMDRSGLVTKVLLDERCPRLFGFFNFGDYVYVGTWGDGVWRKHIRFDPAWYNFSGGLTNLNISDLHINNGVFGAVGQNGEMYYALYEEPWYEIPISELVLESSATNVTASGNEEGGIAGEVATFSGLHSRAVIIDKTINTAKFAIDNYSGLNMGDYYLYTEIFSGMTTSSGFLPVSSGMNIGSGIINSGSRAWIVEYDVLNGDHVGIPYPITYSGEYAFMVLDIENDGFNDYVSVVTSGELLLESSVGYDYGSYTVHSNPTLSVSMEDSNIISYFDYSSQFVEEGRTKYETLGSSLPFVNSFSVFEDEVNGEADVVGIVTGTSLRRIRFSKAYDPLLGATRVSSTTITSPTFSWSAIGLSMTKITKIGTDQYRLWGGDFLSSPNIGFTVRYRDWNAATNTLGSLTTHTTFSQAYDSDRNSTAYFIDYRSLTTEHVLYACCTVVHGAATGTGSEVPNTFTNYVEIYACFVNTTTGSSSAGLAHRVDFTNSAGNIGVGDWRLRPLSSLNPSVQPILFKGATGNIEYASFVKLWNAPSTAQATSYGNYLIYSHDGASFTDLQIQTTVSNSDSGFLYFPQDDLGSQLTGEKFFAGVYGASTQVSYIYNGSTVSIVNLSSVPFYMKSDNIYPTGGANDSYYIVKDTSSWWAVNPHTLSPVSQFNFPSGYTITKPFSTIDTSNQVFWQVTNNTTTKKELLRTTWSASLSAPIIPFDQPSFSHKFGIICGKMFIDFDNTGTKILYVDNQLIPTHGYRFLVLQRDVDSFHLIKETAFPSRIDLSLSSPLLIVGSGSDSFRAETIYANQLTEAFPAPGANLQVRDFRYTYMEQTDEGTTVGSGLPVQTQVLFVGDGGLYSGDATTFSGGFSLMDIQPLVTTPPERIETTNFASPGEFIFITTSGENPEFWQKDNDKLYFTTYSGLPDSRATIIRVDDYI